MRYESVELTEQLMKEREKQGVSLDDAPTCLVLGQGASTGSEGVDYERTAVEKDYRLLSE